MGIISPKGFIEGSVSSLNDLNDVDKQWTKLGSNVNGLNIREEGLDRRVIKTSAWIPNTRSSKSNYRSSGSTDELVYPVYATSARDVTALSGSLGGVHSMGFPAIEATWSRNDTQAIMVRCSFRITWNCSKIMTHASSGVQDHAHSPFVVSLVRSNKSTHADAPDESIENGATWQLSKAFGSKAAYERISNIEYAYDRRSNMSGSVTLCDLITPSETWGGTDIVFQWRLIYTHHPISGAGFPGSKTQAGVQIHDMNFYATPFNK